MKLPCSVVILAWLHGTSAVSINFHPDKVLSLPGAPLHPQFNLFSGYLNGSSSTASAPIFYVLAEAIRVDPSTAPLVLWFNGGPGASSLAAFFKEHGPYRITEKGPTLSYNEFSWNQYANILYFESPLGVGFSQNSEGNMTSNDVDAAEINFNALHDFMTRVHPNYADREYYLSGQSYAGAYAPYLARRLLIGIESGEMENEKFKGFAIGNPVIHTGYSLRLAEAMQYVNHGVMPLKLSAKVMQNWLKHQRGEELTEHDMAETQTFLNEDINDYFGRNNPVHYNFVEHCYRSYYADEVLGGIMQDYHVPVNKKSIACYRDDELVSYMNRIDVQTAFHVGNATVGTTKWESFNEELIVGHTRDSNMLHVYEDIFKMINGSSFRVLIYSGDTDVMISTMQTINSANSIAQANSLEDQNYNRAWRFYGDFAGIRTGYRKGNVSMDVLTVRGAGHSVPTDLPAQAFQMINNFLFTQENEPINYSAPIHKREYSHF